MHYSSQSSILLDLTWILKNIGFKVETTDIEVPNSKYTTQMKWIKQSLFPEKKNQNFRLSTQEKKGVKEKLTEARTTKRRRWDWATRVERERATRETKGLQLRSPLKEEGTDKHWEMGAWKEDLGEMEAAFGLEERSAVEEAEQAIG